MRVPISIVACESKLQKKLMSKIVASITSFLDPIETIVGFSNTVYKYSLSPSKSLTKMENCNYSGGAESSAPLFNSKAM